MEREVRYCTTDDGVRIAYCVEGKGPPILVFPNMYSAFSLMHEVPSYEKLLRNIGEGRTLIRFDLRGIGLSQREISHAGVEVLARDTEAVLDALNLERVSVVTGGPHSWAALFYSATRKERVAALIVFGSLVRVSDTSWHKAMIQMARGNWQLAARSLAGGSLRHAPEEASKLASIYQRSVSGDVAARFMEDNLSLDLGEYLEDISARTLVIHSQDDTFFPFSGGQELSARIPGARLLPLEGNQTLTSLGDKTDFVAEAITAFLDEDPETRRTATERQDVPSTGLRTILWTDLVGHTEMMQRLGDERGRDVLREHETITREVLKANGGTEVKTMGDGFMASFGSVTKAVECAIALQRAFSERNAGGAEALNVRVGLNAGEPIEEDGDLFGATVILASRIAAKADGGKILVADTVRGLCSGKGFLFADRGEFVAKGFDEPVRVYEVNWSFDSRSAGAPGGSG